jgi:hypothetical protein
MSIDRVPKEGNVKADATEEAFLEELKIQFDKLIDLRKALDSKASTVITIGSGLITVNIAIGTFIISQIVLQKNIYSLIPIGALALGTVLAVISIWQFIRSFSIRDYLYPMGSTYFFNNGEYQEKNVNKVRNLTSEEEAI